ncbi:cytokinin riboside 5'-monophosphate phosphoribohydrolase [Bacteroidia bacterium]|nr:cytokinin riboside 5'-monophosphate phosphoribohydrolase [Bacteroidia bacterium]
MSQNTNVNTITVYASSSPDIAPVYFEAAKDLGERMAALGITCINGAGNNGLMAAVTDAVLAKGGRVYGIIPRFMIDKGWIHPDIQDLTVTSDMHTRKQIMARESDACIALPGGIGTLEELLEIITWKQLSLYTNPVIILNTNGFYNSLLELLQKIDAENFLPHKTADMWMVANTPEEALNLIFEQKKGSNK